MGGSGMITYSKFKPTKFDSHIELEGKEDWLVAPVSRNRDSQILDESNFETFKKILDDKKIEYETHRFGHWANGWFEIILVDPAGIQELEEIEDRLEDYPILDEMDYSEREYNDAVETWNSFACKDFKNHIKKTFAIEDNRCGDLLDDIDNDKLMTWQMESNIPYESYETTSEGARFRFDWLTYNKESTTRLARLLWNQHDGK